jgi:hypothetical protein
MSCLSIDEIAVGLVAFLDQDQLNRDPEIRKGLPQRYGCLRPFVCVWSERGNSQWLPLTTQMRPERLRIERLWRSGGEVGWRIGDEHYLNDGCNVYTGPDSRFVAASHRERTTARSRARIATAGIAAILAEVERQRHRRQDKGDAA